MLKQKYGRIIPNQKITTEPANSEVTTSYMDPAEMIAKYGAPTSPLKKRYVK